MVVDASDDDRRPSRAAVKTPFAHLSYAPDRARARRGDAASDARAPQSDCLSCRVLGTSACALGAAIVSWEVYREPRRALSHRIAMGVFAGAFVALGAYRAVT